MAASAPSLHQRLRGLARDAAERAYVPYGLRPVGAVVLLGDGRWIPGVRVENAAFPLTIPALLNAWTTAVAAGRTDVAAVALSRPFTPTERAYLADLFPEAPTPAAPDLLLTTSTLPTPADALDPRLDAPRPAGPHAGLALAREAARRAHVPESGFPVGAVLETVDGDLIPGCNVEHPEWLYILCAERNALSTALSYGTTGLRRLYLTCPNDPDGTPCGACRQVLTEHTPDLDLVMDRGPNAPAATTPADLLPHYFRGDAVRPHPER